MPLESDTYEYQSLLARFCRTNQFDSIPGVSEERAKTYRSLVFDTVEDALRRAYPITARALGATDWMTLVEAFFAEFPSASPFLWRMPYGLYEFAIDGDWAARLKRPYLNDLLYFEWVEVEVHMMPDGEAVGHRSEGDLCNDRLVVNPDKQALKLSYPVFRSSPAELDQGVEEGSYFLLCYRHPEHLDVRFLELSPECKYILARLDDKARSGRELIADVCAMWPDRDGAQHERLVLSFLQAALRERVVLGFVD